MSRKTKVNKNEHVSFNVGSQGLKFSLFSFSKPPKYSFMASNSSYSVHQPQYYNFSILTRWIFYDTHVLLVQDATICNVVWNMCYTRGIGISLPNNAEQKLSVGFNLSLKLHCSTWENRVQIHKTLLCTKILFHCIASNGI